MATITLLMRRKPTAAFFIICYAISWALWVPLILSGADLAELLAVVGLFGPALACLLVSRTLSSPANGAPPVPFRLSFVAAWIFSTLAFSAYIGVAMASRSPATFVVYAVVALLPAYVIASVVSGPSGVRRTLASLARPTGSWVWYALALVLPLAFRQVSVWLSSQIGWELMSDPQVPTNTLQLIGAVLATFLYTLLMAGGLNEELGWTGLALPSLQARFSPLVSTIVLWALWMLWHVPMHLSGYFDLNAHVLIGSFFGRFLLTWLFIRSEGGPLTAILLHTSVNVTSQFVPLTNASLLVDAVVALLVFVDARMWRRLPQESPAVLVGEPLAA